MGLSNVFKRKKQQALMDKISPLIHKALSVLFTYGEEDQRMQHHISAGGGIVPTLYESSLNPLSKR